MRRGAPIGGPPAVGGRKSESVEFGRDAAWSAYSILNKALRAHDGTEEPDDDRRGLVDALDIGDTVGGRAVISWKG